MAIMQSCCCWRSLRKGCYASALYSLGYFTVMAVMMGHMLHEEQEYLHGNASAPHTSSLLEPTTISHNTLALSAVMLCCSASGIVTSLLLVYGIFRDNRLFLVPWIINMIATLFADAGHIILIFLQGVTIGPVITMLFTIDFFLMSLNIYSLLCVVSQYQEYRAGRGTAADQRCSPKTAAAAVAVRYAPRPTATSLLSSRRPTAVTGTVGVGAASPPSPLNGPPPPSYAASAPHGPAPPPSTARKHVQFPTPDSPPAAALSAASADDEAGSTADSGGGGGGGSVVELLWAGGSSGGGSVGAADPRRPADTAPLITGVRTHAGGGGGGILRAPK